MKKTLPTILIIVLICAVVLVLIISRSQSAVDNSNIAQVDTDLMETDVVLDNEDDDLSTVEVMDEFIIELEENQAVGGF